MPRNAPCESGAAPATMHEVENGDDIGISIRSAVDLGRIVELKVDQNNLNFVDGDIISIRPAPGTMFLKAALW